ncbi:MAG: PepSY domain-containing protein [Bacteroidota bacterium]|nr:PepSY domain-containing protein [Bacteroidota bacterium]
MNWKINQFKIHRIIGLIFLPFLIISVVTGFFRANYNWFWKEDYKKIKNFNYDYKIKSPAIGIDSIFNILTNAYGKKISVSEIKLKNEAGMVFYDVKIKNKPTVLIDANNGEKVSPISKDLAKAMASQYVKPDLKFKSINTDDHYKTRKDKKLRPVYIIAYDDPLHTKIYIDKNKGEIEEETDDNLQFGFWMVKLHDYDFWQAKRFNLSFVGIGLFILGCTGLLLWMKKQHKILTKNKKS